MTSPKKSLLEDVQNSVTDKRSRVVRRQNSLFSVNTDLIFEGSVSELEIQQKESLATVASGKSIDENPQHLIKQIYKIDSEYKKEKNGSPQTTPKWEPCLNSHYGNSKSKRFSTLKLLNRPEMNATRITLT